MPTSAVDYFSQQKESSRITAPLAALPSHPTSSARPARARRQRPQSASVVAFSPDLVSYSTDAPIKEPPKGRSSSPAKPALALGGTGRAKSPGPGGNRDNGKSTVEEGKREKDGSVVASSGKHRRAGSGPGAVSSVARRKHTSKRGDRETRRGSFDQTKGELERTPSTGSESLSIGSGTNSLASRGSIGSVGSEEQRGGRPATSWTELGKAVLPRPGLPSFPPYVPQVVSSTAATAALSHSEILAPGVQVFDSSPPRGSAVETSAASVPSPPTPTRSRVSPPPTGALNTDTEMEDDMLDQLLDAIREGWTEESDNDNQPPAPTDLAPIWPLHHEIEHESSRRVNDQAYVPEYASIVHMNESVDENVDPDVNSVIAVLEARWKDDCEEDELPHVKVMGRPASGIDQHYQGLSFTPVYEPEPEAEVNKAPPAPQQSKYPIVEFGGSVDSTTLGRPGNRSGATENYKSAESIFAHASHPSSSSHSTSNTLSYSNSGDSYRRSRPLRRDSYSDAVLSDATLADSPMPVPGVINWDSIASTLDRMKEDGSVSVLKSPVD
ncbi:hypothetical protein HDU93_001194, partial [Gonapodya sp. JEL0774]